MMKSIFWTLAVALIGSLLPGCGVSSQQIKRMTAISINCHMDKIKILRKSRADEFGAFDWFATCDARTYYCTYKCPSKGRGCDTACNEAEASVQEHWKKAVVSRLSVESGCDEAKIKLLKSAMGPGSGEATYRLEACDKQYVCHVFEGKTECKAAE